MRIAIGPNGEVERAVGVVLVAQIDLRAAVAVQIVLARVVDDTDDRHRVFREDQRAPDGIARRIECRRQRAVDDHFSMRAGARRRKVPS